MTGDTERLLQIGELTAERDRLREQVQQQQTELGLLLHSRDKLLRLREQDATREAKIATERDRLISQLNQTCDTLDFATNRLDQAREQVKTLLAACKGLLEVYVPETSEGYSDIGGIVHQARSAIAAVESRQLPDGR